MVEVLNARGFEMDDELRAALAGSVSFRQAAVATTLAEIRAALLAELPPRP